MKEISVPRQFGKYGGKSQLHRLDLLFPETLAKQKKERELSKLSLLAPMLGDDMDSLPDDPWFSKSPEENYGVDYEGDYGQYEDLGVQGHFSGLSGNKVFVGENEGEDREANRQAIEKYEVMQAPFNETPEMELGAGEFSYQDEGGSALDLMAEENWDPRIRGRTKGIYSSDDAQDTMDVESEPSTWDNIKGMFSSDDDGGGKAEGLSPMQKLGAKLVMEHFKDDPAAPQQTIGASPLTPGRTFDMSYLNNRPKKERYRNQGLLGRA